jgi:16S rRNA G966 N2-methylase RsmD
VEAVRANLSATGFGDRATVVRAEVGRFLAERADHVDLAVLDPPYSLTDSSWTALLELLDSRVAVLESDRELPVGPQWETLRVRRYGSTVVTLAASR